MLLSTASATKAQDALTASKNRQALYYNCGAKEHAALSVGQTVWMRHDGDWCKTEVARVLPHHSYEIHLDDGTTCRLTSRHVRFSSEPPIVIRSDDGEDTAAAITPTVAADADKPPDQHLRCRRARSAAPPPRTKTPLVITRSGRRVIRRARYR